MKNKLKICLCTLALALGLMACGGQKDDTLGGRTEADYQSELSSMLTQLSTLDEAAIDYNISYISSYEDGATLVTLLEDYKDCYDEANEYVGIGEFNVEKSGKTITATLVGDYSKRDLKMTFVYSTLDVSTPTAMNIEPVYTLGETMQKAALNTVMGILIVFFMLIVMSGVIKLFEIIPKLEKKSKEKKEGAVAAPVVSKTPAPVKNETDDLQLVAVIAAAIAASTGASTDSFVVRSIKKRH
ncbi:OadG family protein [Pseudobutyrivibrio ruminis]|uniref:OadG family protein n=1 Tax=Pseudobutyrivibrio ruminis TaxID=46206 RepID=UPI00051B3B6E|nr:OadG family protein [Pseudobutyrivibrio ruminis]